MTRVLVLGRTGMVGQMIDHLLSRAKQLEVEGTDRLNPSSPLHFDVNDGDAGLHALWERRGRYHYIINCIGITKAMLNEADPLSVEAAIRVNAIFPRRLASFAAQTGTRLIHLSTDGVFSGKADSYSEDASHDCVDVYGKTKSLGEVLRPGILTVRCSMIGPYPAARRGLLEWFLSLPEGKEIIGYTDYIWNGVTTLQLATLCRRIIVEDRFERVWDESPVHHFCPNRAISKYELLRLFGETFRRQIVITPGLIPGGPVTRRLVSQYNSFREMFGPEREIAVALRELAVEMGLRS